MLLQAALNGPWNKADHHPGVPITPDELAANAAACALAGAREFHVHPRDEAGGESLEARVVDRVVMAMRSSVTLPIGVTTGSWVEPDVDRRLRLITDWTAPDYTSVNLSEAGALELMATLLENGIGVEAGLWSAPDAELLVRSGLAERVTRVLVEPFVGQTDAIAKVDSIHEVLDRADLSVPRLQHGDGESTWILIEDAVRRGFDTRVGLEDTKYLPDGRLAASNAELVQAAREMGAGGD